MNICLFEKEEIGLPLSLRDERAVHILKILHKKVGDSFRAGILDGEEGEAKITKIEKFARKSADGKKSFDDGALYFSFEAKNLGKKLYPLKMIIGFPRPIQLKRLLRDMAGLGVCEIHLCGTDLVEKSYLNSDLADENELHKLLLEGTVQAGGTFVPKVFLYKSLDECLRNLRDESGGSFEGLAVKKLAVGEGSDGSLTKRELVAESAGLTARTGGETKYFALDNVNPKSSLVQELALWTDGGLSAESGDLTARTGGLLSNCESSVSVALGEEKIGLSAISGNLQSGSKTSSSISENLRARSGNLRSDWASTVKTVYAAIGSERGWSERERKLLETFGFVRCGLGSRVLRTETAATVAATLILAKMNFL